MARRRPAGITDAMSMRRVVITGMGAISALGEGAEVLWEAARDGRHGLRPLDHPEAGQIRAPLAAQIPHDWDPSRHFEARQLSMLDRVSQFACIAANEALKQSGLDLHKDGLADRTAVIVGTGAGGDTTHDEQARQLYAGNSGRIHPLTIIRLMINAPASQISMAHGTRGPAFAVASACASSNHAIAQALSLIRSGMADVAICGGTEACFSFSALKAWEAMRVMATDTCRPFSANRSGLVLGEGAGMFVLESLEHARARGATILAELAGAGMSADAADIVHPDPGGSRLAMQRALADAGLSADAVDYINAHGTGTRANDPVETRAIHEVFGEHARRLLVSSTKPVHGHALGAAGALELVVTLGALREGIVPPTLNLEVSDPECDLDYVPLEARKHPVRVAMSNSFAFGGLCAVLVVRRVD